MSTRIRLSLLNGFELSIDGRITDLPQASQRVIAFLACHDKPLQRAFVAGNLWTDKSDARAGANLRSALWRLGDIADAIVEPIGAVLRINADVHVDFREATSIARRMIDGQSLEVGTSTAVHMCSSDLLPDWYDDWLLMSREQFRQLRLRALEALAVTLLADGRAAEAVGAALAAVVAEPLRESASRALVVAHLADGNAGEAIRHYQTYCSILKEEIGLKPSSAMVALIAPLLANASGTPRQFAGLMFGYGKVIC